MARAPRHRPDIPGKPPRKVRVETSAKMERQVERSIREGNRDHLDKAIDSSLDNGHPVNMEDAFPPPEAPTSRMAYIGGNGNRSPYYREMQYRLLHRLLMRNLPVDLIAQQMDVSLSQVVKLRGELYRRLKQEAANIDTYSMFGRTLSFYDEVRGTALRMASDPKLAAGARVGALTVALGAETGKHRFLELAGFYEHNRFAPPPPETIDSLERGRQRLGLLIDMQYESLNGNEDAKYTMHEEIFREGETPPEEEDDDDMQMI